MRLRRLLDNTLYINVTGRSGLSWKGDVFGKNVLYKSCCRILNYPCDDIDLILNDLRKVTSRSANDWQYLNLRDIYLEWEQFWPNGT